MSQHQQIMTEMQTQYDKLGDAILVGPKALGYAVYRHFRKDRKEVVEPHIEYASLEHFSNMARRFLAKHNDPNADDNDVYGAQGVLFSGKLQDRYPVPRKQGEEPLYKKRSQLTAEERAWNVEQLRKAARSRQEHADALEAEAQVKKAA
jgi:hypothetical protein